MKTKKEVDNWFLKQHLDQIEVLSFDYPTYFYQLLDERGIKVNKVPSARKTIVDWDSFSESYSFFL